jgi:hypothetical protein
MPFQDQILIWKLKGKWHFGATFIDNEWKNVIGCCILYEFISLEHKNTIQYRLCQIFYFLRAEQLQRIQYNDYGLITLIGRWQHFMKQDIIWLV